MPMRQPGSTCYEVLALYSRFGLPEMFLLRADSTFPVCALGRSRPAADAALIGLYDELDRVRLT
jgi:hypothetical protein